MVRCPYDLPADGNANLNQARQRVVAAVPTERRTRAIQGLTILELLVVIAIVTAITSLVFPAIQSARERTRNAQCLNNLHQTADALHLYYAAHRILPAGWQPEESNKPSYGGATWILNEMGQPSLSSHINRSEPVDKVDQL